MEKLIEFLHENPNPEDSEVHEWAEAQGLDKEEVEEQIYALATAMVQFLHEGKAFEAGFTEDDANEDQLKAGMKVEGEHTSNSMIAKRIALDHLSEIPDYYDLLDVMESEAKKGNK